ncbi:hypothetical protein MRX96_002797 [Rhipicephalus microplus]
MAAATRAEPPWRLAGGGLRPLVLEEEGLFLEEAGGAASSASERGEAVFDATAVHCALGRSLREAQLQLLARTACARGGTARPRRQHAVATLSGTWNGETERGEDG